jgi:hypothetical protein
VVKINRTTEAAELKWLEKPNQLNGDNLQNVGRETRKIFRKREGNI